MEIFTPSTESLFTPLVVNFISLKSLLHKKGTKKSVKNPLKFTNLILDAVAGDSALVAGGAEALAPCLNWTLPRATSNYIFSFIFHF